MLDHVRGQVARVTGDAAILTVGGIGLRIEMPTSDLASLDGVATVHTVLIVRDDSVQLFGFATERGRELFRALTSVGSVGPRLALAVLSFHPVTALERVLAAGDADAITLVPGIGRKTAQRIVLELRDKLGVVDTPVTTGPIADVREALRGMGFSPQEVQEMVSDLPADGDVDTLLRHALKAGDAARAER
ncbi:MAG TPA: Holliday junction branch migration protein RuvA [Actinomycetota bacterium]|nr:Holliday junction branch migration protein RuvA [Actinomycetota bacterium]